MSASTIVEPSPQSRHTIPTIARHSTTTTTTTTTTTNSNLFDQETTRGANTVSGDTTSTARTTLSHSNSAASRKSAGSTRTGSGATASSASSLSASKRNAFLNDTGPSPRVVYGTGTVARLPTELGYLRVTCPLIVSSPSRVPLARRIQSLIPNLDSRILDSAVAQVPARVVDDAVSRISGRDCVISVGGGSALSLAKAICLRKGLPHICVPTTYSGSENTPVHSGQRHGPGDSSKKFAADDPQTMPTVVIYDEDLTKSQSKRISCPDSTSTFAHSRVAQARRSSRDDNAQWSYIHLPGV